MDYANRTDLLSGAGSKRHGARWTPKGAFRAVYGSLDPQTALSETLGTGGGYGIPRDKRMPLALVAIDVKLARVLDLTHPEVRIALRFSLDRMLAGDWKGEQASGNEAITQTVARLAYELDVQALLIPSARLKEKKNVVIFPEKIPSGSLRIQNVNKLPKPKLGVM